MQTGIANYFLLGYLKTCVIQCIHNSVITVLSFWYAFVRRVQSGVGRMPTGRTQLKCFQHGLIFIINVRIIIQAMTFIVTFLCTSNIYFLFILPSSPRPSPRRPHFQILCFFPTVSLSVSISRKVCTCPDFKILFQFKKP